MVVPKKVEAARAFYVFGDSLVDNGNNNYLPTTARADSPPYGVDYMPSRRPTGRFSNGFNLPDLIGQHIGLSEPPLPYLSNELTGQKLLVGANFASAGIGILNDTGIQFVGILRMFQQFSLFEQYKERLSRVVGEEEASRIVNGALRLVELGARKVLVTGAGPLGCVPSQLASRSINGECVNEIQQAAQIFNQLLFQMINDLNTQLGSVVFIVADAYQMNMNFITNPQSFGFVTSKIACCGQGRFNGMGLCTALSNLCPNRDVYAFWDPFHPTQRALEFIVRDIFNGTSDFMSPMNLSTIMAMDTNI
ncbi:hypothetical protein TSUD_396130 [Trifolium subterraneum]|uniref:GDSL esterase/lipase n=1 Tax=Trifolium subterraneum TaxID=3900 RepID=A0A2Z6N8I8_TRISU|nr:hypothetical protein TSUD_396130 [Trifolium subterraneum]